MKKAKLTLFAAAVALIFVMFFSRETLAYYSTIGKATNVITSGVIHLEIRETTENGEEFPVDGVEIIPGDVVEKVVTIENDCEQPFYLRVKLVYSSTNVALTPEECLLVNLNTAKWIRQADGYLYYEDIVEAGVTTEPVFTQVEIAGDKLDQHDVAEMLSISVIAEAVQSIHNEAEYPWTAQGWPKTE